MTQKYAIYDENDKLFIITSNGAVANEAFHKVLGTATLVLANNWLTDEELKTLTPQQAIDLKKTRKGIR
jgi:hypothetical protein